MRGSGELYIRNDIDVIVKGFRDRRAARGTYLNAASTATWEVRTATIASGGGTLITSGTLDYVTASNGEYVGGIDDSAALVEGTTYYVHVILIEGGVRLDVEFPLKAARRTGLGPVT